MSVDDEYTALFPITPCVSGSPVNPNIYLSSKRPSVRASKSSLPSTSIVLPETGKEEV